MPQLQAGFFINAIINKFVKENNSDKFKHLLHNLSHFELSSSKDVSVKNRDSIVAVINNLISRGLPTFPSTFIEDRIANTFIKTKKTKSKDNFEYSFINDELENEIYRALHIIDPRFSSKEIPEEYFEEKQIARDLITEFIPINIGEFFVQLLSKHRKVNEIFENSMYNESFININNDTFLEKEYDFSIELPYLINDKAGLNLELTTPKEKLLIDFIEQEKLNDKLSKINWTKNLLISDLHDTELSENQEIINFSFDEYFDTLRKNYTTPLYTSSFGLDAMQIALTPLSIARIQKTILTYILSDDLKLTDKKWKIAIIERDVPAAFLAIEDLKHHFENLFSLEGQKRKLPEIDLTIYYTPEFKEAELNILYQGKIYPLDEFETNAEYDLLIDISVLRRNNFDFAPINSKAKVTAKIRSAEYILNTRTFVSAPKILYSTYLHETTNKTFRQKEQENRTKSALNFLSKNIFHQEKLTYLQHKFLINILSNENSLSVLPAKEQKEDIYKLATLLQPGISIIITPLMSSLKFQFNDLFKYSIDAGSYFSASTQKIHDKFSALNKLKNGQSLFNFITPDRLHLPEFRQVLRDTFSNNITISQIIIDQAHCASEWSHDFRPLYATIPNNFKIVAGKHKIPQFSCFTEIASYDVAKDIMLKFNINNDNFVQSNISLSNINLKFTEIENISNVDLQGASIELFNKKFNFIKDNISNRSVVVNKDPKELAERLNSININTAYFNGTIGDKLLTISTLKSRHSYKALAKYTNKEADVLSTTFSLGLSCDFDAKKLFLDVPTSVEILIQTLGKTYNSKNVNTNILFGKDKISYTETDLQFNEEGDFVEKQFSNETETENISRYRAYQRIYPNLKKELQIIDEMMNMITYPIETIADILIRRIHYSFDKWVNLEMQPEINPTKLHVNDQDNYTIGYIDFEKDQIINLSGEAKEETSNQILAFLKYDIEKIVSNGIDILEILNDNINLSSSSGINILWTELKNNEQTTLTVEFYNDAISKFLTKFKKEQKKTLSQNQIIDIYEKTIDVDDFLSTFIDYFDFTDAQYKKYNLDIQNLYWRFRNYFDTVPAIYRLFSIGILDDFIVDFQNQQFTIIFTKKSDTKVINNIYNRISPFISKNQALEVFEKTPKSKGKSIISKAIHYYLQFVHKHILTKRKNSFDEMFKLIAENKNDESKIIPLLNNYFSAKYLIELEKCTKNTDLSVIEQYFEKESLLLDDLEHLKQSSKLLLNVEEGNFNLLIVLGLSTIILNPESNEEFFNSIDMLVKGITIFREKNPEINVSAQIDKILKITSKYNLEVHSKLENVLMLKIHTAWLASFNKNLKTTLKL